MKEVLLPILIAVTGISGLLYGAYQTADVKDYSSIHSCFGECYVEYTKKYGTFAEQMEAKRVAMQGESPADKGAKTYVNCAMCHGQAGEGGIGPKLAGSTSIVSMLQQYKNGETRGPQSALMWGQAANLSTQDMENLQAYIDSL